MQFGTDSSHLQPLDTTVRVAAPEKIGFQYQTVGPFRRLFAYLLDVMFIGFAILAAIFIGIILFAVVGSIFGINGGNYFNELALALLGALLVFTAGAFWFYGAVCETYRNGQTFGKSIAKIRVLSVDGYAIDGVQAMLRNLFRYIDIFPTIPASLFVVFSDEFSLAQLPTCLIGLVCMIISPKFQRLGDLLSGTMVVLVEPKWVPDLTQFSDARVQQLAALIPSDFPVSPSLAKALATFVESTARLGPELSGEIASPLAAPLLDRLGFPQETDHQLFLAALYYRTFSQFNDEEIDTPRTLAATFSPSPISTEGEAVQSSAVVPQISPPTAQPTISDVE